MEISGITSIRKTLVLQDLLRCPFYYLNLNFFTCNHKFEYFRFICYSTFNADDVKSKFLRSILLYCPAQ
jgi:hypothetical protein